MVSGRLSALPASPGLAPASRQGSALPSEIRDGKTRRAAIKISRMTPGVGDRSWAVSAESLGIIADSRSSGRFRAVRELLHSGAAFGIGLPLPAGFRRQSLGCGCSSVVEHDLAKVGVEGSNPFARSSFSDPRLLD